MAKSTDVLKVLQEFKELYNAYQEGKKAQNEQSEFVALLQEELKVAKDAEKSAELKKNLAQAFVKQQQDIISKLLHDKEENENLKATISHQESIITDIQKNMMSDHETEIRQIKQDYLAELVKIQEESDAQVLKIKTEMTSTIEELQELVSEKDRVILSLESENKDLKDRATMNLDIYQQKMAEQEQKYLAELETWKVAELNRLSYQDVQKSSLLQYGTGEHYFPSRPIWNCQQQTPSTQQPLVSRVKHSHPGQRLSPANIRRPLSHYHNQTEFLSATDLYWNNEGGESDDKPTKNTPAVSGRKPKIQVPSKKRRLFQPSTDLL